MKCPKCSGRMVPDRSYEVPADHCFNCGFLIMGERPVVMKEIPPVRAEYSSHPRAIAARDLYNRVKANGGPLRSKPHTIKQEANNV